ncbi:MAG: glutathione S-transferase N-terminal domain-containing protein [Caulobacteraceae bacterium]
MAKPIELHMWPTPNGLKISIALREMGVPYAVIPVNIGAGDQFKPEFQKLSPNGRMPAIVDFDTDDGQPLSIFESGAILQHLGRKTGRFYPQDQRGRAEVEQWLFWQVGGLGPMAGQANHFRTYAPTFLPDQRMVAYGANRYTNEVDRLWGVVDRRLEGRDFLAGDYSIADMACWPWMRSPAGHGVDLDEFPRAKAWRARIADRPAVAGAVREGEEMRAANVLTAGGAEAEKARSILFGQTHRK